MSSGSRMSFRREDGYSDWTGCLSSVNTEVTSGLWELGGGGGAGGRWQPEKREAPSRQGALWQKGSLGKADLQAWGTTVRSHGQQLPQGPQRHTGLFPRAGWQTPTHGTAVDKCGPPTWVTQAGGCGKRCLRESPDSHGTTEGPGCGQSGQCDQKWE